MIEHDARFDGNRALQGIEIDDVAEVLAVVDDQRHTGRLPALAGAAAARKHRHFRVTRDVDGVLDVVRRFRDENPDWGLLVN